MREEVDLKYPLRHVSDNFHIRLLDMDLMTITEFWDAKGVRSSYWRLYINTREGPGIRLAQGFYPLAAHRVHFIPAWVHFSCFNDRAVEHFYIHFDVIGLPGPLVREVFDRPFTLKDNPAIEGQAQQVKAEIRKRGTDDLYTLCNAKSLAYLAFSELLLQLPAPDAQHCQRLMLHPNPVAPAVRFIEGHLAEPVSNDILAEQCGLSADHFIRVFHHSVGQTPARYVLERRIATAAQRLVFSDESIEQIAQATGFPNRFSFSRAFSRQMGVGPAGYRRTGRV